MLRVYHPVRRNHDRQSWQTGLTITTHTKADTIGGFGVTNGDPSSLLPGSAVEHNPLVAIFIIQTNPWLSVGHDSDPKAFWTVSSLRLIPIPPSAREPELSSGKVSFVVSENDFTRLNDLPGSGEVGSCTNHKTTGPPDPLRSRLGAIGESLGCQRIHRTSSGWFILFPPCSAGRRAKLLILLREFALQ